MVDSSQIRNTGGPADGATVTPNDLMVRVSVFPPTATDAVGGVVMSVGTAQQKTDTLLDPETAIDLAGRLVAAAQTAMTPASPLHLPDGFRR